MASVSVPESTGAVPAATGDTVAREGAPAAEDTAAGGIGVRVVMKPVWGGDFWIKMGGGREVNDRDVFFYTC